MSGTLPRDLDEYLPAIVAGDAQAFGQWVAGVESRVRDSLRSFAAAVDTEAVLQEALLRIWQVAPRHIPDGRPESLLRLAIRIARNLAIDESRKMRAAPVENDDLEAALQNAESGAHRGGPDPFLRKAIEQCRDALPPKPAEALMARLTSGGSEPDEELAKKLGMRVNTFLQNFTRARKLLADCLEQRGIDLATELS
ncbi:MAG: sigma-70 family RNA polymerase sigma factor [Polyangiaceae bacterium]